MHPPPRPDDGAAPHAHEIPDLPADEHVDSGRVADDLAQAPDEKRNATDGYAPADERDERNDQDDADVEG